MQDPRRAALEHAVRAIFQPLAGLFADWALSVPDAESLLRDVLVHGVYQHERRVRGKRATVSRVARLTGVHRNVVRQILRQPFGVSNGREEQKHRGMRVLEGWTQDPLYQTAQGEPRVLPMQGRVSFHSLCVKYAPGYYPPGIKADLVHVGAVEVLPGGRRLRALRAEYGPATVTADRLEDMGVRVRDLLLTLVSNLSATPDEYLPCETALTLDLDPKYLPMLRQTLAKRLRAHAAGYRADLNSERMRRKEPSGPAMRVGVTSYVFASSHHLASKGEGDGTPKKARRKVT